MRQRKEPKRVPLRIIESLYSVDDTTSDAIKIDRVDDTEINRLSQLYA